jgi:predicted transcriptional regulator
LVSHIFGGRAASVMQALLKESDINADEIGEIRQMLDSYEAGLRDSSEKKPKGGK